MEDKNTNALYCSHCGALIGEDEDYEEIDGENICMDCVNNYTCTCDECNELIFTSESYGDEYWNCQEMCSQRIPKILDRQESGGVMS